MVVKNDIVVECPETVGARSRKDVIRKDIKTIDKYPTVPRHCSDQTIISIWGHSIMVVGDIHDFHHVIRVVPHARVGRCLEIMYQDHTYNDTRS